MKFTETLRKLWRRWYIVLPGIIVAAAAAAGVWNVIPPGYERTATQLLIPGAASMPDGANPYLFLGGLAPAADVLVRAIGSENVLNEVVTDHPGVKIEISRDTTTAGPVILIVVTAPSDPAAEQVLGLLVDRTATVLKDLQRTENIPVNNRVTVLPITVDTQSVLQQRSRLIGSAGAGIVGVVLTLLVAGLVDGFSVKRRRRTRASSRGEVTDPLPESPRSSGATGSPATSPEPSTPFDESPYDEERAPVVPAVQRAR
ncbi:hypothetical protein [Cryobacterium fucosi]|uniref:Polysaccharide chain length determinant N-terminal domain-containing protein n=1 Tax=Cryobacterium fucosi TaxID=1259157 RepID=A0A4R9BCV0_9MICO|nr:hypothetical protein [Cryobacterium fucosi]TFD79422.1 hypothetical protein E3T48_05705 [Cryobacterium fucosi]